MRIKEGKFIPGFLHSFLASFFPSSLSSFPSVQVYTCRVVLTNVSSMIVVGRRTNGMSELHYTPSFLRSSFPSLLPSYLLAEQQQGGGGLDQLSLRPVLPHIVWGLARKEGKEEGRNEGWNEGNKQVNAYGKKQGRKEGSKEGRQEGIKEVRNEQRKEGGRKDEYLKRANPTRQHKADRTQASNEQTKDGRNKGTKEERTNTSKGKSNTANTAKSSVKLLQASPTAAERNYKEGGKEGRKEGRKAGRKGEGRREGRGKVGEKEGGR